MKAFEIRIAISKLVRKTDVLEASTLMVDVFHMLPDKTHVGTAYTIAEYDDSGVIHTEPINLPIEEIVILAGYKIWREGAAIFFEKTDLLGWDQRNLYCIKYDPVTRRPKSFRREIAPKNVRIPLEESREVFWRITDLAL